MARPVAKTRSVRKHVTLYNAAGKPRPATITAVGAGTTVTVRESRGSSGTATVSRCVVGSPSVNCWQVK